MAPRVIDVGSQNTLYLSRHPRGSGFRKHLVHVRQQFFSVFRIAPSGAAWLSVRGSFILPLELLQTALKALIVKEETGVHRFDNRLNLFKVDKGSRGSRVLFLKVPQ